MLRYYRLVLSAAWERTWARVWSWTRGALIVTLPATALAVVLAVFVLPALLGVPPQDDAGSKALVAGGSILFVASGVFAIVFFVEFVRAPARLWQEDQQTISMQQAQLASYTTPCLVFFFDADSPNCVQDMPLKDRRGLMLDGRLYRIGVRNVSGVTVVNVRVVLTLEGLNVPGTPLTKMYDPGPDYLQSLQGFAVTGGGAEYVNVVFQTGDMGESAALVWQYAVPVVSDTTRSGSYTGRIEAVGQGLTTPASAIVKTDVDDTGHLTFEVLAE